MEKNKTYWFKRKRYGYGWVPTTWKGWSAIILYLVAVLLPLIIFKDLFIKEEASDIYKYVFYVLTLTVILVAISYLKGPKAKWRWGVKEDDNPEEDY